MHTVASILFFSHTAGRGRTQPLAMQRKAAIATAAKWQKTKGATGSENTPVPQATRENFMPTPNCVASSELHLTLSKRYLQKCFHFSARFVKLNGFRIDDANLSIRIASKSKIIVSSRPNFSKQKKLSEWSAVMRPKNIWLNSSILARYAC